jgi:hypothetical protein
MGLTITNRSENEKTPTELIFGKETPLVNTSDAIVKRITFEKNAHDLACKRARAQADNLVTSYDAVFSYRVGQILNDVEVELPQLPAQFLENEGNNG